MTHGVCETNPEISRVLQVLIVDDIASRDEAAAARAAAQRGTPVIAAAQARGLVDLLQNDELHTLLTGTGRCAGS